MRQTVLSFAARSIGMALVLLHVTTSHAGRYEQAFGPYAVGTTSFDDGSELRGNQVGSTAQVVDPNQKELQLTANGTADTRTAFVLPVLDPGRAVHGFSVKWNAQVYAETTDRADGFSLTYGQIPTTPENDGDLEDGFGIGLTLAVRTYINNAHRGFAINVDGVEKAYLFYDAWGHQDGTRHLFELDWNEDGNVNFWMDGVQIFTNVAAGFTPQAGDRFCFGARTGGQDEEVRLDNIIAYTGGTLRETDWTSTSGSGSTPPSEGPEKAYDLTPTTKWLALNQYAPYLQARVLDGIAGRMVGYTITSANDGPARDPHWWRIQGSRDGSNWVTLDTEIYGEWGSRRYSRRSFLVDFPDYYNWYRMQVDTNHVDVHTQLADFRPLMHSVNSAHMHSTIRDFDRAGPTQTPYAIQVHGGGYTPTVIAGPATSNILQLTDGGLGEFVSVAFDQTCSLTDPIYGTAPVILVDLDFRAEPVTGQADGMSIVLLRTADFGSTGPGATLSPAEEPNLTSASGANFGVAFDVHQGGTDPSNNHVSLHYGSTLTEVAAPFDISTDRFHHAQVRIAFRADRSGADVTVILQENSLGMATTVSGTPQTVIPAYFVPGLLPYGFRVQASARTGGQTSNQQFDNLYVICGDAAMAWGGDMRGAGSALTLVGSAQLRTDTGGNIFNEWLNLTTTATSQNGSGWLTAKQAVQHGFTSDFQWQVSHQGGAGADGLCFTIQNNGLAENPNEHGPAANALTVTFDTYQNGGEVSDAMVKVRDGATNLQVVNVIPAGFNFNDNPAADVYSGRYNVHIDYFPGDLDVYLDDTLVIDSLDVTLDALANGDAVDADGKAWLGFSGRTGGATENHDILNWHLATYARPNVGTIFAFH